MFTTDIEQLNGRYQLLCRASHFEPDDSPVQHQLAAELRTLQSIITDQLPELARQRSPHNFAELQLNLQTELERFHEFCEFPDLAGKVAVGLGGAFSAGKSSLINALLGCKRLATEVDPTTSLPTYLLKGKRESITALNLFKRRVELTQEEFLSLTHDEKERYGSQISGLLQSAFISLPDFPFDNLTLLDTPGYSKPDDAEYSRADENIARAQLNSAQFIIWVVSAEGGVISENDLRFLASLRQDIPVLVVLSRADKRRPEDIQAITELVKQTLDDSGLSVLDVIPFSSRKKKDYPIEPIRRYLSKWNLHPLDLAFERNFKRPFSEYRHFILKEHSLAKTRLEKLNRIAAVSDDEQTVRDSIILQQLASADQMQLSQIQHELGEIRKSFFHCLHKVGKSLGVSLQEKKVSLQVSTDCIDKSVPVDILSFLGNKTQDGISKTSYKLPSNWISLKKLVNNLDIKELGYDKHPADHIGINDSVKYNFAIFLSGFVGFSADDDYRPVEIFNKIIHSMGLEKDFWYFFDHFNKLDNFDFSLLFDEVIKSNVLSFLAADIFLILSAFSKTSEDFAIEIIHSLSIFLGLDNNSLRSVIEFSYLRTSFALGRKNSIYDLIKIVRVKKGFFENRRLAFEWLKISANQPDKSHKYKKTGSKSGKGYAKRNSKKNKRRKM